MTKVTGLTDRSRDTIIQEPSLVAKREVNGPLAQMGERLLCTQEVVGSTPIRSTILQKMEVLIYEYHE
jgi:hypothetical protein